MINDLTIHKIEKILNGHVQKKSAPSVNEQWGRWSAMGQCCS